MFPQGSAVNNRFLLHWLSQPAVAEYATQNASGINLPRISYQKLAELEVKLPPLPEQRRIVARIEELQSRTRRAREALEGVPVLLEQLRQSVLASAFRGNLTADWRESHPDVEPASVLLERIRAERRRQWEAAEVEKMRAKGKEPKDGRWKQKYKEPEPVDSSELPELPEGWEWTTLELITASGPQNGLYLPKTAYGAGTPIIRIEDYQSSWSRSARELKRVEAEESLLSNYRLIADDVLINRVNSPSHLGKCMVVEERNLPAVFESNIMRLHLAAGVNPRFVTRWLESPIGRTLLTEKAKWAVNQASINQQDVQAAPIPVAPTCEQARVASLVSSALALLSRQEERLTELRRRSDSLDQAVLSLAFRGELVSQDPSDEPASVLLERLREERDQQRKRGRKS